MSLIYKCGSLLYLVEFNISRRQYWGTENVNRKFHLIFLKLKPVLLLIGD